MKDTVWIRISDGKMEYVRDLIQCKNCRKWTNGDDTYGTCNWNQYQTLQTRYDDYCSYGDRK